jgi:hypothetical protein
MSLGAVAVTVIVRHEPTDSASVTVVVACPFEPVSGADEEKLAGPPVAPIVRVISGTGLPFWSSTVIIREHPAVPVVWVTEHGLGERLTVAGGMCS